MYQINTYPLSLLHIIGQTYFNQSFMCRTLKKMSQKDVITSVMYLEKCLIDIYNNNVYKYCYKENNV